MLYPWSMFLLRSYLVMVTVWGIVSLAACWYGTVFMFFWNYSVELGISLLPPRMRSSILPGGASSMGLVYLGQCSWLVRIVGGGDLSSLAHILGTIVAIFTVRVCAPYWLRRLFVYGNIGLDIDLY